METHRKKSGRCGTGCSNSAPGAQDCWAQLPTCREEFSMSTEQLLVFFLAVWFFYFFCFQD